MPINLKIIHVHEFLKVSADGQLDLEGSKELLLEIASASSAHLADHEIIIDIRKMQSKFSTTDLWYLAAELGNLRKNFSRKTALVCLREDFDSAGFFALCAQNRGLQVMAFTSYEEAIEWLGAEVTPPMPNR
jgi:uncharacterized protein YfkK (UPF0435 family)